MFQFIQKLIASITLNKVFIWVAAIAVSIVFYTIYENRRSMFIPTPGVVTNPVGFTFSASARTQEQVKNKVNTDNSIIGISIKSADLRLNEALSIFLASDDPLLTEIDFAMRSAGTNRMPLFSSIGDANIKVIQLINGQFICVPFNYTLFAKMHPELKGSIKIVCSSSIPSYYGFFSGFIQFFINEDLSLEQQAQLKITAERLSTEVYLRDVIPAKERRNLW